MKTATFLICLTALLAGGCIYHHEIVRDRTPASHEAEKAAP